MPIVASVTFLTSWCLGSSWQAIQIQLVFFRSTVTAQQCQLVWFSIIWISFSTAALIGPADIFLLPLLATFEVSIVQYNVLVKVVGVVLNDERVCMLLG